MNLKELLRPIGVMLAAAIILLGLSTVLAPIRAENASAETNAMLGMLLPDGGAFVEEEYTGEDTAIRTVYKGETGYVIETVTAGYVDDIVLMVGVSNDGAVTGMVVRQMNETYGLGGKADSDLGFLGQFIGTTGDAAVGETVDSIAGATVSSKAVTKGVNSAVAFVTGADVASAATEWEG